MARTWRGLRKCEILTCWSHESTGFCYFSSAAVSDLAVVTEKLTENVFLSGSGVFTSCCDKDRLLEGIGREMLM